ncbi:MAG: rubrerythrin family protein [Clostridium sp.]|nr:rubrerythrin family protein [Clostridium sp.]
MEVKGSKTEKNLYATFAGESRARNQYTFFADKAGEEGLQYIRSIFLATAENEKAHAREVFRRYLKLVKSTEENLKTSAEGEAFESSKLYKQFEKEAREEGFTQIADFYKELAEVEEHHMERFKEMRKILVSGKEFSRDKEVMWQCMNCGYIHVGKEAPEVCPLCKYPKGYFKVYCTDFK